MKDRIAPLVLCLLGVLLLSVSAYTLVHTAAGLFPSSVTTEEVSPSEDPGIEVERVDWAQCRNDDGTPRESYWMVIHLSNGNPDYWIKGQGVIRIINGAGEVIREAPFGETNKPFWEPYAVSDLTLPAGSRSWFMLAPMLRQRKALNAEGGPSNRVELDYQQLRWLKRDGSEAAYSWVTELVSHSASADPYPRHDLDIKIVNTSKGTMHGTRVFGVVYKSTGELADIVWSEEPGRWPTGQRLKPGKSRVIHLKSISETGRCLGEADPNGYTVEYWVNTMTSSGQPLVSNHAVLVP